MTVFRMPSLGADMEDGTLIEWLVHPGDRVQRGDVVAVVETHKGAIEIEIFETGEIERLEVEEGVTVPVGSPLAMIRTEGEPALRDQEAKVEVPEQEPSVEPPPGPSMRPSQPTAATTGGDAHGRRPASPAARRRAAEAGFDLASVSGSGPRGAVLLADVEALLRGGAGGAETPIEPTAPPRETPPKPSGGKPGLDMASMRQAIAAAMSRSKREIPHYYLRHSIDLQSAADWLEERNAERDPDRRLLMGVLFMKATALAVARTPELNGHYENGEFRAADTANVGMAVSLRGGGLIAPAVPDVAGRSLDDLMTAMRDLVVRTRTGRLKNSEMTGGTITISSMGENGVESLYGVIYPPQVALLGFGTPLLQPRVVDGTVRPRISVIATLAGDHRVSDGRRGARLLTDIARLLNEPEAL